MDTDDLRNRFTYRSPQGDQPKRYELIRSHAFALALELNDLCPDSREKSLAVTHLEDVVMWANASIARHTDGPSAPESS
jgi:hypothetical protein